MTYDQMMLIRLRKEIESEISLLDKLADEYGDLPGSLSAPHSNRLKASIFHDFYTGAERIFRRIAEELNGGVPRSESWHRQLLLDMNLELKDVRPKVITKELCSELGKFLRFRHLFRNMYGFELDSERIAALERDFDGTAAALKEQVAAFVDWMASGAQS